MIERYEISERSTASIFRVYPRKVFEYVIPELFMEWLMTTRRDFKIFVPRAEIRTRDV
jgi:hypothetical protein